MNVEYQLMGTIHRPLHMAKLWFTISESCEYLSRVYLQDAKFVNKSFAMCNSR